MCVCCRDEDLAEALDSVGVDQDAEKNGVLQVQNLPPSQRAKLWMVSVCEPALILILELLHKTNNVASRSIGRYYRQLV